MFRTPDNQKADSFSRTRPESVDDLHCFCFCRDFSSFLYPTASPQNLEMSVVQTEGFEYTERSEASGKLRVHAASPGRRFFSTSTTRSCQGTPKKHSTQNTQFAHVLFLFLLLNVFLQLLVFVLTLRCHSCFCCCAPNRLQGMCQFYESLYLQLVKKK